jgi:hypothetical protein
MRVRRRGSRIGFNELVRVRVTCSCMLRLFSALVVPFSFVRSSTFLICRGYQRMSATREDGADAIQHFVRRPGFFQKFHTNRFWLA